MWCGRADARRRDFYLAHGFTPTRVFHRMKIDLTASRRRCRSRRRASTIRTFDRARDAHAVHEAIEAAFAEHFRPTPRTFEEWETFDLDSEATDLSLWRIAWAGGQVIGEVSPMLEPYGGYVDDLAVLKPWRGRGVGRTLLLHAFAVLWEAGAREVYLGVDSDNATGATQLYEGVGMRVGARDRLLREGLCCQRPAAAVVRRRRLTQPAPDLRDRDAARTYWPSTAAGSRSSTSAAVACTG